MPTCPRLTGPFAAVVLLCLFVAACGQPRPAAQQGEVCRSIATKGHLPYPWPDDITPEKTKELQLRARLAAPPPNLPGPDAADFRATIADQAAARRNRAKMQGMLEPPPTQILSVSAGGAWGAFSIGFLDGWGQNPGPDRRPEFEIVTGVSTGSMIAPAIFLGDPQLIAQVRELYATLKESDIYTQRPFYALLSSPSLFDTAPLRARLNRLLTTTHVEKLAAEHGRNRTLAVMATNLDSGMPKPFNLTKIAADTRLTLEQRRQLIVSTLMASSALPIGFPPEFIGGDLYVDGGLRLHVFFINEIQTALASEPLDITVVVSGDMAVSRDCTGLKGLGLLSMAQRTAVVGVDQLLRTSVQSLMAAGAKPGNKARMITAASLIDYGAVELPPGSPRPPCALSDQLFDPVFSGCLVRNGTDEGRANPVPWTLQIPVP